MPRQFRKLAAPVALVVVLLCGPAAAADSPRDPITAAWVQFTVDGAEARAVVQGSCPRIELDHQTVNMHERAAPTDAHPNRVCSIGLPRGIKRIVLDGVDLPVPVPHPRRIGVVGDTGCRLSAKHGLFQACNNDSVWPFAHVATQVAAARPELIIYTGDYIYRESPCPEGNKGCAGSPHGDNQATWLADWLQPAKPIHAAAPLLLIRGNHETCSRAGAGWFRYLDARPYDGRCEDMSDPWLADIGQVTIAVIDSTSLEDVDGKPLTGHFAAQLRELGRRLPGPVWLATHQPIWGVGADDDTGALVTPSQVLQDAVRKSGLPADTRLLISAHIHLAEALAFADGRPPTLIVANGGTELVDRVTAPAEVDGEPIKLIRMFHQFGFLTLEREGAAHWDVVFRDIEGRAIEQCRLAGREFDCLDD